jgi:hypothetical protein
LPLTTSFATAQTDVIVAFTKELPMHVMRLIFAGLLCTMAVISAHAAVGLTTVPERDVVRMTIYNAVDLTLVQETRTLILKKGLNRIQYQWAGTLIDATSLELRPVDKAREVDILGIIYPPNAPATLLWEVESRHEGEARFEISYFTSGLSWNADYVLRATGDERQAELEGWVSVVNNSGEHYPRSEVRLVVGNINLVESIRDLASGQLRSQIRELNKNELKRAGRAVMEMADAAAPAAAFAAKSIARPEVESARLGDYHIFTVSGIQDVQNGATTRFQAITTKKPMALEVLYRVYSGQGVAEKIYRFINDKAHELPDGPLPDGMWHIFRLTDATEKTLSFSGTTHAPYIPPNQKVELSLGNDPGIAVKTVHEWHGETNHHYNNDGRVDAWVSHDRYRFTLVNTKPIPVSVEYLVLANGDWSIDNLVGERRDAQTYRHQASVLAGGVLQLGPYTVSVRSSELVPLPRPPVVNPLPKMTGKP